ncbi:MAG TPA: HAMP domain-containing protein, partial [Acidobacteriota bacterium]
RLATDLSNIGEEESWKEQQKVATFGDFRKQVWIAARSLEGIGYLVIQAAQDYENLPFVAGNSPFQELFRGEMDPRLYQGSLFLNVYDPAWHPIFISSPDVSPTTEDARDFLRTNESVWIRQKWSGRDFHAFYFRIRDGYAALYVSAISFRSHLVHLLDLLLFNLLWLSIFTLILAGLFRPYLALHFPTPTPTRFNFFQKLLFAFVVFSMVPMLLLSVLIRNYVWEKKIDEVTSRALNSFSVASKVVGDYLFYSVQEQTSASRRETFSNELLEWISQVIQQDIHFYYDRYLRASSNRELFTAGLLGEQLQGNSYVDLFLKGQKYSISEVEIGTFKFLNVSGRIYTGRHKGEVITIPFLIEEKAVEAEITGLREYMMLVGAGLIVFAVFLGFFLANRFSRPVEVLIKGTGEMARGNLDFRIREIYRDEFQQLVDAFNAMAGSLDEQQDALQRRRAYIENILNHITTAV